MCVDYRTEETKLLAALNIAESLETIGIADNRADDCTGPNAGLAGSRMPCGNPAEKAPVGGPPPVNA
jgi:hypothetical protein